MSRIALKDFTSNFMIILLAAFSLEAAAYMALPYLSLHLRDHYQITEVTIGTFFLVSILLRPLWSMLGTAASSRLSSISLLSLGAFVSGVSIGGIYLASQAWQAFLFLVLANAGLALWNPSLFSFVIEMTLDELAKKARLAQLNVAMYVGAAIGSAAASALAGTTVSNIFLASSLLFNSIFFVAIAARFFFRAKIFTPAQQASLSNVVTEVEKPLPISFVQKLAHLEPVHFVLAIASFAYWASYTQFNSYFSLYATDWLNSESMVGIAFAALTISVAVISFAISKSSFLQKADGWIAAVTVLLLGTSWLAMAVLPSKLTAIAYLLLLAISEAFMVLILAELWGRAPKTMSHFMQSLNYAICNLGMGLGSLMGGVFYRSPKSGTLAAFGLENFLLMGVAGSVLFYAIKKLKPREPLKIALQVFPSFFHEKSNTTISMLLKKDLIADSDLKKRIVEECEMVQDQVWNKKFETSHNTISQDILLLACDSETGELVGFGSGSHSLNTDQNWVTLYHSDVMILPEARHRGLYQTIMCTLNEVTAAKFKRHKIINVLGSGYIYVFKCFESLECFKSLDWTDDSEFHAEVMQLLRNDFGEFKFESGRVIRNAWQPQNNGAKITWPADLAIKYNFPMNVNYFDGDIMVKLYSFDINQLTERRFS